MDKRFEQSLFMCWTKGQSLADRDFDQCSTSIYLLFTCGSTDTAYNHRLLWQGKDTLDLIYKKLNLLLQISSLALSLYRRK